MITFCPFCKKENEVVEITKQEELNIRDELITVERKYFLCESCGEEFEVISKDYDPEAEAYREYRYRKNWLQPEEIKDFREALGLTQQQLSDLTGIGVASLNRYENGALQSESNNQLLSIYIREPWLLLQIVKVNQDSFTEADIDQLQRKIEEYTKGAPQLLSLAVEQYSSYPPNILNGEVRFDFTKFIETAKIFCFEDGQYPSKLLKLLFYTDFKHYKDHGRSVTGMRYARLPYGPVPNDYKTWLAAFTEWTKEFTTEYVEGEGYSGEKYSSTNKPILDIFTDEELTTIDFIKKSFKDFSATEIENYSHKEKAYKQTKPSRLIPYSLAVDLSV